MQDQDTSDTRDTGRRALLFVLSLAGVMAAAMVAPRLGWPAGLEALGATVLVLVVLLLAVASDSDDAQDASDSTP